MADQSDVQFIRPPMNLSKAKVGTGPVELDLEAIARAEAAIESAGENFRDWAVEDLTAMEKALADVRSDHGAQEACIKEIFRRAMDMKGQGGSFGYVLITQIGDLLKKFTEDLQQVSARDIDIITAHVNAMKVVIAQDIKGDGGKVGAEIVAGLARLTGKG
jgi:chemotaxis protein histidine kinase CheA